MSGWVQRLIGGSRAKTGPVRPLRIMAVISVYQDELYLERCFCNMADQGIEAIVIDNDANPQTRSIVEAHCGSLVREVIHHPRSGFFDWSGLLQRKQDICNQYEADWFLLWDSDEIREPPLSHASLRTAIEDVDGRGFNTISFDEFVFMPTSGDDEYRGRDYVAELDTYYFFQPHARQRMNAWRKPHLPVNLVAGAGHTVSFRGQRIAPEQFVMRHYLFLSLAHGLEKYGTRVYAPTDLAKGWSQERARTTSAEFRLPPLEMMKRKLPGADWDRSSPLKRHPCFVYD
jgi:hypothetical protein